MVDFLAYSSLRAAECSGLEIGDLAFTTGPASADGSPTVRCSVNVRRTTERRGGQWVTTTPKSKRSRRTVPLPGWLAERMHAYLAGHHPRADGPTAPLWPSRHAVPYDWSQPIAMSAFYHSIFQPALVAVGLPVSAPANGSTPATRGVRLHDLRHSMATMQLMAGTHFMQVSMWLGHSTFTLTPDTYGDWIPEEDGGAGNLLLPPPPSAIPVKPQQVPSNVVPLFGKRSG
jgi:integrase